MLGEDGNDQLFGSGGHDEIRGGSGFDEDRERGAALFDVGDTNGNGVLDNTDDHVTVASATYQGETRLSTIIELGERHDELFGTSGEFGADDRLVVFGVTGLTVDDVAPFSVEPFVFG